MIKLTRRQVLGSTVVGAALLASGRPLQAASKTLNLLSHNVHRLVLTTGVAGDLMEPWRKANDAEISRGQRSIPIPCRIASSERQA